MTEAELNEALEPVKEYFFGANVSVNTVLSAYLRAAGLHPSGQTWQMAKYAVDSGGSFADAVVMAGGADPSASPGGSPVGRPSSGTTTGTRSAPTQHGSSTTSVQRQTSEIYQEMRPEASAAPSAPPRVARELPPGVGLTWFPKQFGVGDIDGDGAAKLLGTPNLAPVSVLVRETAQNSWDARRPGQVLEFTLNLRELDAEEVELLLDRVFTRDAGTLPIATRLRRGGVWALEVSDRGAKGLGGPLRNDLAIPEGEPTDFMDLVLNIGAPRDVHLGGGTYGFGKTVAYTASQLGTVLLWSRTGHEGRLQHRLIGSAFGSSFQLDGKRFTGRHWWGVVPPGEERVEPLLDDDAEALGENLFSRRFEGDETGTSLLILDPVLGGDDREDDVRAIVESVLWHLWPKLVQPSDGRDRMSIAVQLNGQPVDLPEITRHPVLSAFADALFAVRRAQGEGGPAPVNPTEVMAVEMLRPIRTLGHLAVTRFPRVNWDAAARDVVPVEEPVSHVALMRHDAELLVKYMERQELDSPAFQWCAVFKPVADVDDAFALSEPPSHDDWVASSVKHKGQRQIVNVALRRIRELVDEALAPAGPGGDEDGPHVSVAELADSLASLMGPVSGSAPARRVSRHGGGASRTRVQLGEQVLGEARSGRRQIAVCCELVSRDGPHHLTAEVRVGVEGGAADVDDDSVTPLGWTNERPHEEGRALALSPEPPLLEPGQRAWYVADVAEDLLADFDVRILREVR